MIERIHVKEFRCNNCLGMEGGEPTAYVNNSGWCKGCVMRLKHWWAWFIPPVPNEPLKMLTAFYMCAGYGAAVWFIGFLLFGSFGPSK